jgi:anaerobic magnesium-protoporphyrin IX monomethyl ester cyclase
LLARQPSNAWSTQAENRQASPGALPGINPEGQPRRKVVLFSPPYQGKVFGPPLGLLSLAASIREEGFAPVIVDGATTPNFLDIISEEVTDAFAFGVSVLTGPMIRDAVAASRLVRQIRPDLPVIYGGWHPTLLSAQTLREDFVDIVVRHQGEKTLTEILKRQSAGATLDLVAGCWCPVTSWRL